MRKVKQQDGGVHQPIHSKAQLDATRKYRRMKTIVQKILDLAGLASLKMVLYVWDPKK